MPKLIEKLTVEQVVAELKKHGSETTKRILMRHGAREPFFGVKVEDLKKIQKRVKRDYELSLALFDTGIGDAMYLAGLIADDERMTKKDLKKWVQAARWGMIGQYAVAPTAAQSRYGWELALEWIESKKEHIASTGWATLCSLVATKDDGELDLPALKKLLARVVKTIHAQPGDVRYTMNCFVIALGSYVRSLTEEAKRAGQKIGLVEVEMGETACKVPFAPDYIAKVEARGAIGKKRKQAKC
jgi:3-methyladenine DNA glycosylase AlkD